MLQTLEEIDNLKKCISMKVDGDVIEAGVYEGGSASIIYEKVKNIYLYDTFDNNNEGYDNCFNQVGTFEKVTKMFPFAIVIKGKFPKSARHIRIAFAHLDLDGQKSTLEAISYVYPLLPKGGIILAHDYQNTGLKVRDAIDEYMSDKLEKPIRLSNTSQCLIVKE